MKKNCFFKFLCVILSFCILLSNGMAFGIEHNLNEVYAAQVQDEASTQTSIAENDEVEETKETERKNDVKEELETTQTIETEIREETEIKEETQTSTVETPETTVTKTEELTETETTEIQESVTETVANESEPEELTAALEDNLEFDSELSYIESLLEQLKQKYPNIFLNADGYFEYTDENGIVYTYDPYDPELCKYLLDDEVILDEYNVGINQYNANGSDGSTISPFTKKTYYHENHVSNKVVRHGIDVSKYQGDIDWEKAKKAGVTFAFVRVGYRGYGEDGKIASDDKAKANIQKAHDAGIKVGVYFFSQAVSKPEASEEAEYCINFLKNNGLKDFISLPVVIDYEYAGGENGRLKKAKLSASTHQNICDRFVQDVRDAGYKGGIYANYNMLTDDMRPTSSALYDKTQYWIARYNEATHYSDNYRFWQYASNGTVDGISGKVDCNFWYEDKRNITKCRVSIYTETDFVTDYIDDIKEALSIYDTTNKYELIEDKDYTVTVTSQTVDGTIKYNLLITGIGQYMGNLERKDITMAQHTLSETMIGDIAPQEYTGLEITQETGIKLEVNNGNTMLTEGKDYTVSYSDNIEAGTGYVIVTGMGNYTGEVKKAFSITGMKLKAEMFEDIPNVVYTGSNLTTDTGVIIKGTNRNIVKEDIPYTLEEGKDYTLKYLANKNVGMAKVTVIGKGNYAGELPLTFQITEQDFSETAVVSIGGTYGTYEMAYTGKALKPSVTVMVNNQKLSKSEYTIEYGNNINLGTEAYVLVKGAKNYTGEVKKYFTIVPKAEKAVKLTSKMVSLEHTHMYTKVNAETGELKSVEPELYVVSNTKLLEKNVDYAVTYQNKKGVQLLELKDAGEYTIVINGIGAYTGKVTKKFTLVSESEKVLSDTLTEVTLVSEPESLIYTGKAIKPQIEVKDKIDGKQLSEGADYQVSYMDNKAAGTARIVIKGKGAYKGEVVKSFSIFPKNLVPKDLEKLEQKTEGQPILEGTTQISLNKYTYVYNGKKQQPKLKIKDDKTTLKENRDFTVTYRSTAIEEHANSCINADNYFMEISFKGNYAGTAVIAYEITPADFSKVKVKVNNQLYTGNAVCPDLDDMVVKLGSVKLDKNALEGVKIDGWYDNTNVGKAGFYMTITELQTEQETEPAVKQCRNFTSGIVQDIPFKIVKKQVKTLEITVGGFAVSDKNKCDLELVYNDGIEYNQSNGANVVVKNPDTGEMLVENTDYSVKFSNNKNAGNAKVKISGTGGYSGSRTITFKIIGKSFDDTCRIELSNDSYVYNNSERKPSVKFYYGSTRLKSGSEYTVKYEDNINAGTAKVIVTGKGKYSGTLVKTFTILPKQKKDISKITVSSIAEQKYTGNVIVPNVTVTVDGIKLTKGKDYTVSVLNSTRLTYTQNKKRKGIATMVITGVGNYRGTLTKRSFVVVEK